MSQERVPSSEWRNEKRTTHHATSNPLFLAIHDVGTVWLFLGPCPHTTNIASDKSLADCQSDELLSSQDVRDDFSSDFFARECVVEKGRCPDDPVVRA